MALPTHRPRRKTAPPKAGECGWLERSYGGSFLGLVTSLFRYIVTSAIRLPVPRRFDDAQARAAWVLCQEQPDRPGRGVYAALLCQLQSTTTGMPCGLRTLKRA